MKKKGIDAVVDRFEGDWAVLEVGKHGVDWPIDSLPDGTREGSRLRLTVVSHPDAPDAPKATGPEDINL